MKREFISPLVCVFGSLSLVVLIFVITLNVTNKKIDKLAAAHS